MDSREAREILACYRPGVDDPRSEPLAAALEQARRDPELALWLERELALDAAIGAKMRETPVPAGLKSRILAGRSAAAPPLWRRRPFLALAPLALAAIAAIALFLWDGRSSPAGFASYRAEMAALVSGEYKLDVETEDLPKLQAFFAERGWPADYAVPAALQGYPLEGGMAVRWHGEKVSVVCFGSEDDESKDLWMFVVEARVLPDAPASEAPEFSPVAKLATSSWRSGARIYLLARTGRRTEPPQVPLRARAGPARDDRPLRAGLGIPCNRSTPG